VTYLGTSPDGANRSGRVDRSVGAGRSVGRVKITTSLNRIAQPLRPTRPAPTLPTDPQSLPTTPQTRERLTCVECRQVHYDRPPLKPKPTTPPPQARSAERAYRVGSVGQAIGVGVGRSGAYIVEQTSSKFRKVHKIQPTTTTFFVVRGRVGAYFGSRPPYGRDCRKRYATSPTISPKGGGSLPH
jgi:hypothetical protein